LEHADGGIVGAIGTALLHRDEDRGDVLAYVVLGRGRGEVDRVELLATRSRHVLVRRRSAVARQMNQRRPGRRQGVLVASHPLQPVALRPKRTVLLLEIGDPPLEAGDQVVLACEGGRRERRRAENAADERSPKESLHLPSPWTDRDIMPRRGGAPSTVGPAAARCAGVGGCCRGRGSAARGPCVAATMARAVAWREGVLMERAKGLWAV